jgi:predicted SPOUT superfamily RNA methylase MTH1
MPLLGTRLAVAIPDTVLEEKESLREKTVKLGVIARACAIYGVDLIEVFRDPRGRGEASEISKVLEYLETPQYLRKRLFPLEETLRYAGILPPLRIPSHLPKVPEESVEVGDFREGVTNGDGTVDVGLDVMPKLRGGFAAGRRVTVRYVSLKPPVTEVVQRDQVPHYWGYRVETKSLPEVLNDGRFRVRIATSRRGSPVKGSLAKVRAALATAESVKLIFGSPSRGLFDMAGEDLGRQVDFVLNLFPGQQVETVRTEEAVFVGLGFVSLVSAESVN